MIKNLLFEFVNYIFYFSNFFKIFFIFKKKKNEFKLYLNFKNNINKETYFFTKINNNNNKKYFKIVIFENVHVLSIDNLWVENTSIDKEVFFYKIRFNWLLFDNEHLSHQDKINLMKDFIKKNDYHKFDSYSVSERISNWIMYIKSCEKIIQYDDLEIFNNYLRYQIYYLINNLEYHDEKTNNHIISNAKSIYLYSLFFNNSNLNNLSKKIFIYSINKNFYKSGFLNEGSSHYQLLISKHIIEILYFNKIYKDINLDDYIINFFYKVLKHSFLFTVNTEVINFGDLTPDIPSKYLKLLPFLSNQLFGIKFPVKFIKTQLFSKDYINLFNLKEFKVPILIKDYYYFYDKESGYLIYKNLDILFFTQLINSNVIKPRTHQHSEIGNFILFYKNELIFLDKGRFSYEKSTLNSVSSESHNFVKINNFEPMLCHKLNALPEIMNSEYFQKKPDYNISLENQKILISVTFYGFERFPFKSIIKRKFFIEKDYFEINDKIISNKNTTLVSFFHFNGNLLIKKNNQINLFTHNNKKYLFYLSTGLIKNINKNNYYSTNYAVKKTCSSIIIQKKITKKYMQTYKIKF